MPDDGYRIGVLKQLAARLVLYQTALERGEPAPLPDPSADGRAIDGAHRQPRLAHRIIPFDSEAFSAVSA